MPLCVGTLAKEWSSFKLQFSESAAFAAVLGKSHVLIDIWSECYSHGPTLLGVLQTLKAMNIDC